jgi:hypothetical protein
MFDTHRRLLVRVIVTATTALLFSPFLHAGGIPRGWYLAGSKPADYAAGVDPQVAHGGHPSAFLKAQKTDAEGFGTLMQDFRAQKYAGKRIRLSAFAKTEAVRSWAALWMRIDKGADSVAFDNMQNRPLKGTLDWQNYQVVLDVPSDATGISFGVLLGGPGTVWLSNVRLEVVGPETPTTGNAAAQRPDGPTNLDFRD